MGSHQQCHVALLAFPFGTHASPLLSLAKSLSSATAGPTGPTFSFLTTRRSADSLVPSVAPSENISFHVIDDGAHLMEGAGPQAEVKAFLKGASDKYRKALEEAVSKHGVITCVVGDAFLSFAGDLVAEMGLKWVPLWTGGPCSLQAHLYTDFLRNKFSAGDDSMDVDLEIVPGLAAGIRARDLPEGVIAGDLDGAFAILLHEMSLALPRTATTIILNTFQGLDPAIDTELAGKFETYLPIGPLNLLNRTEADRPEPDRFGCLAWLDRFKPNSVAYISFGTVVGLPPHELAELALGLESSGVPFLWSLKDHARAQLPDGFLDRTKETGLVISWVPQLAVLKHTSVGAFVTHCGWNSVLESITCGVPMICRPFLGDQMVNSQVVSNVWKVGVRLPSVPTVRADIAEAIKKVVGEGEGRKMRERASEISRKANKAVEPDGSSVKNFRTLLEIVIS